LRGETYGGGLIFSEQIDFSDEFDPTVMDGDNLKSPPIRAVFIVFSA
jgi:hypothetical protein